jgi:2-phospho-L-lactate guanylyltransferase
MDLRSCAVLVPVKPPAVGKSRLGGPDERRRLLAVAFALDTVTACLATPRVGAVLAVTDDAGLATRLAGLGCAVVPDGPAGDLNATLRLAAAEARRRWPRLRPAVVCADLPALHADDLADALDRAPVHEAAFVADHRGVGTTMYTAPYDVFAPRFEGASRAAHLDSGAREIDGPLASLRLDVDEMNDLARALELGVGPHTADLATQ